jgi:adenylate cyclase
MWPLAARTAERAPSSAQLARLLADAEIGAERIVAFMRCGVGFAASLTFFTVIVPTMPPDSPLARQIPFIAGFSLGYLSVGLVSLHLARPEHFRGWMTWLFTTLDLCLWLALTAAAVFNFAITRDYVVAVPPVLVAFILLALVSLRNNPWLQAYALCFIVAGLATLVALTPGAPAPAATTGPGDQLFSFPQTVMRLSMVALTGATLLLLTRRTRSLLQRAIEATAARANLTRYLPPQLAGRLAQSGDAAAMPGRLQDVAVVFVDIRGFTTMAEGMDPRALSGLLAEFRRIVSAEVHAHDGIVDKFVGDSVMAVFGAVDPGPSAAANSVASTLGIVDAIGQWSDERRRSGLPPLAAGAGAHWGEVFCGSIGDSERLEFTVLGDTVNIAARLQTATKETGCAIVVSQALLAEAGIDDAVGAGWTALPDLEIRGRSGRLLAYGRQQICTTAA